MGYRHVSEPLTGILYSDDSTMGVVHTIKPYISLQSFRNACGI
jgi:hypothetical protein